MRRDDPVGWIRQHGRFLAVTPAVAFLSAAVLWSSFGGLVAASESVPPEGREEPPGMEEQWGVQILGIRLTAEGYMLDFRYRILDPEKAAPLFRRKTKPYLIDEASGGVLVVPGSAKVGPLRNSNTPLVDRTYWMFFANPGVVKRGAEVTVVIGDFRAENVVVE